MSYTITRTEDGIPESVESSTFAAGAVRDDKAWQSDALCSQTDPESFFPEKGISAASAKRVCNNCDVQQQCLEYALAKDERFGIWGGLTERERRRARKEMSRA